MTKDAAFQLLLKQVAANAKIKETATYAREYKQPVPVIKEKIYSISWFTRAIFLCLAAGCIYVIRYACYQVFVKHTTGYAGGIFFILLILFTLGMALTTGLGKSKIVITTAGMTLNDQHYPWPDILATYIVAQPGYKSRGHQLVLTLKNGSIIRHPLNVYHNMYASLAAHIEYFKRRSVH